MNLFESVQHVQFIVVVVVFFFCFFFLLMRRRRGFLLVGVKVVEGLERLHCNLQEHCSRLLCLDCRWLGVGDFHLKDGVCVCVCVCWGRRWLIRWERLEFTLCCVSNNHTHKSILNLEILNQIQ